MSDEEQIQFRTLPGLPPYGPLAKPFPSSWGRSGREGLVVEFSAGDAVRWVGNFRPGINGVTQVLHHPNRRCVLVLSTGDLWAVDVVHQTAQELSVAVEQLWPAQDSDDLIGSRHGL